MWRSRSRTDRSCRDLAEAFAVDRKACDPLSPSRRHLDRARRAGHLRRRRPPSRYCSCHLCSARRRGAHDRVGDDRIAQTTEPRTTAPPRLRSRARPSIQCPLAVRSGRHAGVTAWRSHARAGSRRPTQTCLRCRTGISSATPRALVGAEHDCGRVEAKTTQWGDRVPQGDQRLRADGRRDRPRVWRQATSDGGGVSGRSYGAESEARVRTVSGRSRPSRAHMPLRAGCESCVVLLPSFEIVDLGGCS